MAAPLAHSHCKQPQSVHENADEQNPKNTVLLGLRAVVPEEEGPNGERKVVITAVRSVDVGDQGNYNKVVTKNSLTLHFFILSTYIPTKHTTQHADG